VDVYCCATKLEQGKNKLIRFETIISNLSSTFVNINSSKVDRKIEENLKFIIDFFALDRAAIIEYSEDLKQLNWTHSAGIEIAERKRNLTISDEHQWFTKVLKRGNIIDIPSINDLPEEAVEEKKFWKDTGIKSNLTIPMKIGKTHIGGITLSSFTQEYCWSDDLVQRIKLVGNVFGNALTRKRSELKLKETVREIKELKEQLENKNNYLKRKIETTYKHEQIVGKSKAIKTVLSLVEQVASTKATVLIQGETGTGKELLARAIHKLSPRKNRAMVTVNCAALPASLLESELFGCEKGAYTGSLSKQIGRFEVAGDSTIFLDEIGELPLELQAKILRVLQEGKFEHLGSSETIFSDVRVIAATNRDLFKEVQEGRFREDLFYRLNVFPLLSPPLRDRSEDIPLLVWVFINEFSEQMGKSIERISKKVMEKLQNYPWPGNVRELRNVIERAMILSRGTTLQVELPTVLSPRHDDHMSLEDIERRHILYILNKVHWRIRGKNGAAEILGLFPTTLDSRIKKLGIKRKIKGSDLA
jgi:transcriptional regulator with GAF, ATPase, and Fis domain